MRDQKESCQAAGAPLSLGHVDKTVSTRQEAGGSTQATPPSCLTTSSPTTTASQADGYGRGYGLMGVSQASRC